MARRDRGRLAVIITLLTGAAVAAGGTFGFLRTHSVALLSGGALATVGVVVAVVVLATRRRTRRTRPLANPSGHGRERYFPAFATANLLLVLGAVFSLGGGAYRLHEPRELTSPMLALAVAGGGILLAAAAVALAVTSVRRAKGSESTWPGFLRRSPAAELPLVLGVQAGGLAGLTFAAAAVAAAHATGDARWDAYGAMAAGGLMILLAATALVAMHSLLVGRPAGAVDRQRIAAAIEIEPSVTHLLHLRTVQLGPDELFVGAKIELISGLTVDEVTEVVGRVETNVRRTVPSARVLYFEPDIFRTSRRDHAVARPAAPSPRVTVSKDRAADPFDALPRPEPDTPPAPAPLPRPSDYDDGATPTSTEPAPPLPTGSVDDVPAAEQAPPSAESPTSAPTDGDTERPSVDAEPALSGAPDTHDVGADATDARVAGRPT